MKIIEAMKKVKANREKIADLQRKIRDNSAHLSHETPAYENPKRKIADWAQSCRDLTQECITLLTAISRTNLATPVTIELEGRKVTKTIAEWIWRRREFAAIDATTFQAMTDRNLRPGHIDTSTGGKFEVHVVRNYDIEFRDACIAEFTAEQHEIDAALEVVNAVTDIITA